VLHCVRMLIELARTIWHYTACSFTFTNYKASQKHIPPTQESYRSFTIVFYRYWEFKCSQVEHRYICALWMTCPRVQVPTSGTALYPSIYPALWTYSRKPPQYFKSSNIPRTYHIQMLLSFLEEVVGRWPSTYHWGTSCSIDHYWSRCISFDLRCNHCDKLQAHNFYLCMSAS
jgi:hypothetical protein